MNIFNRKKTLNQADATGQSQSDVAITPPVTPSMPSISPVMIAASNGLAEIALNNINDGIMVINYTGAIEYLNSAAVTMLDCKSPNNAINLDYSILMKIEDKDGHALPETDNPLFHAIKQNQTLERFRCILISGASGKRIPISITLLPAPDNHKVITFRNISKELSEEGEQAEFISTASHEMRTPVATIDGYITLALNPKTATIDDRARGYLESASKASKHLGKLFQDLLDVTKLDDGRIRPELVPVEMISFVKEVTADHLSAAKNANLVLGYGANNPATTDEHRLEQMLYSSVDVNFLREIIDNLIDNAIKYTPAGGSIYVNAVGSDDRIIISVADTGIGISSEDLQHIFQKFYRADNSDTREIGGTGLGLYLVKQRVEAMGGRVWAESNFGQGTVFYVSLPRISADEYQKRMIAVENAQAMAKFKDRNSKAQIIGASPGVVQSPMASPDLTPGVVPSSINNVNNNVKGDT